MQKPFPGHKPSHTTKKERERRYAKSNERIAVILSRLYAGEILSMRELADEFDVNLRTIQRDVNERMAGFPIRKNGDRFGLKWAEQNETAFTPEEISVLELLDELSKKQGNAFYSKAHNLLKKLKATAANPFYAKLDMEDIGDKLTVATKIEKAIKQKRLLQCVYKMEENKHDIDIKPLKIANFEGFWYVIAMDARNDIVKKYLLRNISDITVQNETFDVSSEMEEKLENAINVWFDAGKEPFEVRLFIDAEVAKYFRVKPICKNQAIEGEDSDGSIEAVIKITHEMEIVPIVKYWMPHIHIVEPKWLDDMIRKDTEAYLSGEKMI
ncbi:helix-turn-helix transcriptional regulator [Hydrogenimonas cancrithermarum]|uniref:Transcriptional regulator n=1 Tax=Hydrogenimonas cancrithermarum TaxID=2993563 RepID=A0ABN6WXT7_9BACT|nr:WYL domain-containing protein [Hydrogenimonas cancrithermarum]BDY13888.1 transcriptional regulator [Hydrogenimonas cancrithermarum]